MGKVKYIPPIPDLLEDAVDRIVQLEEEAILRRRRKMEAMRRYRAKKRDKEAEASA